MPDKKSEHRQQTRKDFDDGKLTEKETVIPAAYDGIITAMEAADRLDITKGHIFALKRRYKAKGNAAFVHKSRGCTPSNKTPVETKKKIVDLKNTVYKDIPNIAEVCRKLKSDHGITEHPTTIRNIFSEAGISAGGRGGSKPGHSQPAPSKIKELDIPKIESWIEQIEVEMAIQSAKSEELQYAIEVLRKTVSGPNPIPTTVNKCVLDIKKIIGELSSLTSSRSNLLTVIKKFNIMDYEKI
jgi:transposase